MVVITKNVNYFEEGVSSTLAKNIKTTLAQCLILTGSGSISYTSYLYAFSALFYVNDHHKTDMQSQKAVSAYL